MNENWKTYLIPTTIILAGISIYAVSQGLVFLFAIPIGFLFGFFLQKGDLCSASAMSEVLMFKDSKKLFGFWVAIVTTMVSFVALDFTGLVSLSPKHLNWLSYLVGGVIFGAGMVLAGGCISGVIYKGASGNFNSLLALLGVAFGISIVHNGLLNDVHKYMQDIVIKGTNDEAITLSYLTGLPYWSLVLLFLALTIFLYFKFYKSKVKSQKSIENIFNRSWKPWTAGIAIGILGFFAYFTSVESGRNYALGITNGVVQITYLFTEKNFDFVTQKPVKLKEPIAASTSIAQAGTTVQKVQEVPKPAQTEQKPASRRVNVWLMLIVVSMFAGSFVSAKMSGKVRLLPKPPEESLVAIFGGLLVGIGAAFSFGCTIGNILSGWALMSVGNLIFGVAALLTNWLITYIYLMGGLSSGKSY